jgi:hypothetical protein
MDAEADSSDLIATGVVTTWTYELSPSATKCVVADAIEDPMRRADWTQRTLETTAPDRRSNVRNTDLYKRSNYVSYSWAPSRLSLSVTASSEPPPAGNGFGTTSPFIPCFADPQP